MPPRDKQAKLFIRPWSNISKGQIMIANYPENIHCKVTKRQQMIQAASGKVPAELVLKNTTYVNVFSNELCSGDIALADGHIVGIGTYTGINEIDCSGKIVLPAFIDAHIHLESALVSPYAAGNGRSPR